MQVAVKAAIAERFENVATVVKKTACNTKVELEL
jgi:hypothetical protein